MNKQTLLLEYVIENCTYLKCIKLQIVCGVITAVAGAGLFLFG